MFGMQVFLVVGHVLKSGCKIRFQLDHFPHPPPSLPPLPPLLSPLSQLTRRTFFEADLIDQQREEEERKLVLAEEREESSNGGGKGKEGGEGRKVTSAMAKCSPGISKAQLGKKGSCVFGREGGCGWGMNICMYMLGGWVWAGRERSGVHVGRVGVGGV